MHYDGRVWKPRTSVGIEYDAYVAHTQLRATHINASIYISTYAVVIIHTDACWKLVFRYETRTLITAIWMDDSMIITNTWLSQENKKNKLLENVKIIIKCSMNIRTHNRQLLALWNSAGNLPQKYSNHVVFVWVILIYINLNQITISHMQPDYWLWLVHFNWHWQRIRIQRRIYFHWYRTTGAFIVYFGSEKKNHERQDFKIYIFRYIHSYSRRCMSKMSISCAGVSHLC